MSRTKSVELEYCSEMLATAEAAAVEARKVLRNALGNGTPIADWNLLRSSEVLVQQIVELRKGCKDRATVHALLAHSHGGLKFSEETKKAAQENGVRIRDLQKPSLARGAE